MITGQSASVKILAGVTALALAGMVGHVMTPTASTTAAPADPAAATFTPGSAPSPSRTPGLYTPPAGWQASSPAPQASPTAGQQQGSSCGSRQQQGQSQQGNWQQQGNGQQQQQGQGNWQQGSGNGQQQQGSQQGSSSGRGNSGSALQARRWGGNGGRGGRNGGGGRWRGSGSRGNRQGRSSQANCQSQGQGQGNWQQGQGQGNGRQQGNGQQSPAPGQSYGPQQPPTTGPSSAAPPAVADPAQPSSAPTGACGVQPSWAPSGCLKVSLDDEFNGNTLPPGWSTGWFGTGITGPVNSMECAKYNSSNVSVSGGYLHLAMQGGYGAIVTSDPRSGGGFQFTYGLVEWRAYLPALSSNPSEIANWPALWVNGPDGSGRGEYDVVEGLHGSAMSHIPTDGNVGFADGGGPGWHTFGVSWTQAGTVTFYHDGQQVGQRTGVPNTGPMYLVMGNQCGSSTQQSGTDMLVDWVRAWS